jgi:hypothetical protein
MNIIPMSSSTSTVDIDTVFECESRGKHVFINAKGSHTIKLNGSDIYDFGADFPQLTFWPATESDQATLSDMKRSDTFAHALLMDDLRNQLVSTLNEKRHYYEFSAKSFPVGKIISRVQPQPSELP